MIRGAIFDVDGTLLDSMPIWKDAGEKYLMAEGLVPEKGLGDILFPLSLSEGAAYLKKRFLPEKPAEEIREGVLDIIGHFYREEAQLKPGMAERLEEYRGRGIRMAVATTGNRELVTAAFSRLGIDGYFSAVFSAEGLRTSKREPGIFLEAARALGTKPGETLVLEDALYALQTAKSAGFLTAAVEDDSNLPWREEMIRVADYYIPCR